MDVKKYEKNINTTLCMKKVLCSFVFCLMFISVVGVANAHAASLYFSPSSGFYTVGDRFSVRVLVASTDQPMNAAAADISFSNETLEIISISQSGSILNFWAQEPTYANDNGKARLEGVALNGGYQGSAGELATIIFQAHAAGGATLRFNSGSVLADDGFGTSILSKLQNANFTVSSAPPVPGLKIPESIPEGFQFTKNLRVSDYDIDVAYLQLCLTYEGLYSEDVTGSFDQNTRDAVIKFQEKYLDEILDPWGFTGGTGLVYRTTRDKLNELCPVLRDAKELPEQLFDISATLENAVVTQARNLVAIITFESPRTQLTLVDLTYTILDTKGRKIFKEKETVVVETYELVQRTFEHLYLPVGSYILTLQTQYNVDVIDIWQLDFEVVTEVVKEEHILMNVWFWIGVALFLLLVNVILLFILVFRMYREKKTKNILYDIEKCMHVIEKHLPSSKADVALLHRLEKDLSKIEKRLEGDIKEVKKRLKKNEHET